MEQLHDLKTIKGFEREQNLWNFSKMYQVSQVEVFAMLPSEQAGSEDSS